MKILISAGHGGKDSGAVAHGYVERDWVTGFRNKVAYYLKREGYNVLTDGIGAINLKLRDALGLLSKSDLGIEFHLNAGSSSIKGVEVFATPNKKVLAQQLAQAISKVTGSHLRGDDGYKPASQSQHGRLAFVKSHGLLVELEFITNKDAMSTLDSVEWVVAKEIATVIINYVKGKK